MPVIPIGDGKLLWVDEGFPKPPPPKKPKRVRPGEKKRKSLKKHKYPSERCQWASRHYKIVHAYSVVKKKHGRPLGSADGMTREQSQKAWAIAREKAKQDMAKIKEYMTFDDDRAEEALLNTLEVMRSPMNQEIKLKAARQVLEWTRAKPVTKSEVTVNAAEAWLASLDEPKDNGSET